MRSLALMCLTLAPLPALASPNHAQCAQATFDAALARHGGAHVESPDLQLRLDSLSKTLAACPDPPQVPPSCLTTEDATAANAWSRVNAQVRAASVVMQQHSALPTNATEQVTWRNTLSAREFERRASVIAEKAYEPLNNRPLVEIDADIRGSQAQIDALQADRAARVAAEANLLDLRASHADVSAAWNRSRCRIVQCTAHQIQSASSQLDPACPGVGHARSASLIAELRLAATEIDRSIEDNEAQYKFSAIAARLRPSFEPNDLSPDSSAVRVLAQAMQGPVRPMGSLQALWSFVRTTDGLQRLTPDQRRYVAYARPWIARWRRAAHRQRALLDAYEAGWHVVGIAMEGHLDDDGGSKSAREARSDAMQNQRQLAHDLQNLKLEQLATYQEFL